MKFQWQVRFVCPGFLFSNMFRIVELVTINNYEPLRYKKSPSFKKYVDKNYFLRCMGHTITISIKWNLNIFYIIIYRLIGFIMPAKMVSDNLFLKGEILNESMCMIIKETE